MGAFLRSPPDRATSDVSSDRLSSVGAPVIFGVVLLTCLRHADTINETIKSKYLPIMQSITWEGRTYGPPEQIEWYPGGLGWKVTAPKKVVRKSEPFRLFQRFLVGETEIVRACQRRRGALIVLGESQSARSCLHDPPIIPGCPATPCCAFADIIMDSRA